MSNLKDEHDHEALIPIGAQIFLRGTVGDTSKVLIGLGAGISVEKTVEQASAELQSRVANMQKAIVNLRDDYSKLADKISSLRAQLGETAQQIMKDRKK
jgi:prefoldin alpha subunit